MDDIAHFPGTGLGTEPDLPAQVYRITDADAAEAARRASPPAGSPRSRGPNRREPAFAACVSRLGFAVVQDGSTLLAGGIGCANVSTGRPVTASTPFYIASTTKAFMGLASAVLAERGRWNLDAPVSRYLPALRLQPPLDPTAITMRQLLTHTHGISNEGPVVTKLAYTGEYGGDEDLMRLLRMHPPEPTGPAFSYGNIGYNVAAFAMAEATGLSWRNALESILFEPLAMRGTTTFASLVDTGSVAQPYGATPEGFARLTVTKRDDTMHSAGGVFSTPADMGRWLEAQ